MIDVTEVEAIRFAERTRGSAIELLNEDLAQARDAAAAFVFGDFNDPRATTGPSRRWSPATSRSRSTGRPPAPSKTRGFIDTFRAAFPDEVEKPGFTWTPTSKPTVSWDHHDRIDFVLARADDLSVRSAAIIGEKAPRADIVVKPWPSDHRAVAATVEY